VMTSEKACACRSILLKKMTNTVEVKELGKGKWKRTEVSCDKEIERKNFSCKDNQEIVPFFFRGTSYKDPGFKSLVVM